jgi:hypothetical protein
MWSTCSQLSMGEVYTSVLMEFSPAQAEILKRLFLVGFRPIAIPPYEKALIVHRGSCAALLEPVENGGLRLMAPVTWMVDGNLGVRLKKPGVDVFVWKKTEVAATPERLAELDKFREELLEALNSGTPNNG